MIMSVPKVKIEDGRKLHFAVGAIIKQDGKYLLIDRANPPYGFAGLAGHVDEEEGPEEAVRREVKEEGGITVSSLQLLFDEFRPDDTCVYGVTGHFWKLSSCEVEGIVTGDSSEAKSIGWFSADEIRKLSLEPTWKYWFMKLGILDV